MFNFTFKKTRQIELWYIKFEVKYDLILFSFYSKMFLITV